jgi:hypothetical protein
MASGTSSLDAKNYLSNFETKDEALAFLEGYGYDLSDPIQNAEMFTVEISAKPNNEISRKINTAKENTHA